MDNRAARRRAAAVKRRGATPGRAPTTGVDGTTTPGGTSGPDASQTEALVVSHWFDPGEQGHRYSATVRLTGRRVWIGRLPGPADTFTREERVDDIIPGSGAYAVTSWVYGLEPGDWTVSAELIRPGIESGRSTRGVAETIPPARWSWRRWAVEPGERGAVRTRWALLVPLARMPSVIPGSFTVLGILGILVALLVQSAILARDGVDLLGPVLVFLIALVAGLLGAKVWYALLHPGPWPKALLGGWAVDGFLVVAPLAAIVVLLAMQLSVGRFLDAVAPGIFFAVAIGRLGCFFTGCCAGRCTRSRWGVWSMDRDTRIGARRIPTQLLESLAGLVIGIVAAVSALNGPLVVDGLVFVVAAIAYFSVRHMLLRLRSERRDYLWRRSGRAAGQRA